MKIKTKKKVRERMIQKEADGEIEKYKKENKEIEEKRRGSPSLLSLHQWVNSAYHGLQ